MSILVTVAELQERARVLCDVPTFSTDTHVTSAMVLDFVRLAAQKLSGIVQSAGAGEHYLTSTTNLTTTASIPTVSLPTNTMDVVRVSLMIDGDREVQLDSAQLDDWDPLPSMWNENFLPRYRVMGNTLRLFPTPVDARTLRVYYTGGLTVTATSDVLGLRESWDEYIVNHVCVLIRNRQNKDASEFREERALNENDIRSQLRRDRAGIRQVRDVRYEGRQDRRYRGYYR